MGFQSGINAALGSVAGAALGISKTLKNRQEEQVKKVAEIQQAKKEQQQRFKQSLILDKSGQNLMVPIKKDEPQQKKSIILDTSGRNLTNGK